MYESREGDPDALLRHDSKFRSVRRRALIVDEVSSTCLPRQVMQISSSRLIYLTVEMLSKSKDKYFKSGDLAKESLLRMRTEIAQGVMPSDMTFTPVELNSVEGRGASCV